MKCLLDQCIEIWNTFVKGIKQAFNGKIKTFNLSAAINNVHYLSKSDYRVIHPFK
jgi:hypothetical protein